MIDFFRGLLGIGFMLGFAILVHEFGHFAWAKICGVRVLRFSIGFGKFIFSWTRNGTEYGVAWFPLGGYVMLHGAANPEDEPLEAEAPEFAGTQPAAPPAAATPTAEAPAPTSGSAATAAPATPAPGEEEKGRLDRMVDAATSDSTALFNKPYYQKLLIYGGGVAMNWITAVFAIGLMYSIGMDAPKGFPNVIGGTEWPAAVASERIPLRAGDRILEADGHAVGDWNDFLGVMGEALRTARESGVDPESEAPSIRLRIERPEVGETVVEVPAFVPVDGVKESPASYIIPYIPAYIEGIMPNKPADKAGLRPGDEVVAIDGKPIPGWREMASAIRDNPGISMEFQVRRGEEVLTLALVPVPNPKDPSEGQIGITAGSPERELIREPVLTAFRRAPGRTANYTVFYVKYFGELMGRLAQRQFRAVGDEVGGPIQIAQIAYRSANQGLIDFLWVFFAFNIALAIFNLIPIPLLDGSLLVFATWEAVFGKPFPRRLHIPLLYAGLALILMLFVAISINDVIRVFG